MKLRVGVVGHTGYSGQELVRILVRHPSVEPILLDHRETTESPKIRGDQPLPHRPCTSETVVSEQLALVLMATPPEASMELAPAILAAGARAVDLSGAFRLGTPENYTRWYKGPHTRPGLLREAVYGLPDFC